MILTILLKHLQSQGCNFSIICIQETWLSDNYDTTDLLLEGFNLVTQGTKCSSHAGLAIYVKKHLNFTILPMYDSSDVWEGLFIELKNNFHKSVVIGNIYRPPRDININYQRFISELTPILSAFEKRNAEVILAGDFNIDLLQVNRKSIFSEFFDLMTSFSFYPKVTLPTRLSKSKGSLIDNFFVKLSDKTNSSSACILTSALSDHFPYFIAFKLSVKTEDTTQKYIRLTDSSAMSLGKFKEEIRNSHLKDIITYDSFTDPNYNYNILDGILNHAKQKHLPLKEVKFNKSKHKKSQWITKGLIKSINFRDKMYRDLKNYSSDSTEYITLKLNLGTYNYILRRNIYLAKKSYYANLFQKYKSDVKQTWSAISDVVNRKHKSQLTLDRININGTVTNNKQNIINYLNDYFTNIGSNIMHKINKSTSDNSNTYFTHFLRNLATSTFSFQLVTENEICEVIKCLNSKNSCGSDGISSKLIKYIFEELSMPLTVIINQIFTTGIFPDNLKTAKIHPLLKAGDPLLATNYRPISLLTSISKIFEKIIFNQLTNYLSLNNILTDSQYGFRKNHSTQSAALELIDRLMISMDKGKTPLAIFLDFSKAFDTLDHEILLYKLKYYGIKDKALFLFRNYLTNRRQYTELGGVKSNLSNIKTGVPQGSILGPLLFLLYINDIADITKYLKTIIYADDTTFIADLDNIPKKEQERKINSELQIINLWLKSNKLSLNCKKSKFIVFYKPPRKTVIPELLIDNEKICCVDEFNFLGLTITKHLSWKKHIDKISNKISKIIGVLNKLKFIIPDQILLTIYNSLILPHLNYCILAWGYDSKRLYKLQKKALRIINKSPYLAHTDPMFIKYNVLKVKDILEQNHLKFLFKLSHRSLPVYFYHFVSATGFNVHTHNTRHRHNIRTPKIKHEFRKKCLRFSIVNTFNLSPSIILDKIYTHSFAGFCQYIKKYYLAKYDSTCIIQNCYVCQKINT